MAILSVPAGDVDTRDAQSVHTGTSGPSAAAEPQHAVGLHDLPARLDPSKICYLCMEEAGTIWCCRGTLTRRGRANQAASDEIDVDTDGALELRVQR